MKRRFLALSSLVLLAACASAQPNTDTTRAATTDNRLVGTWELLSTRITSGGGTTIEGGPPEIRSLKILNGTDYSVLTRRGSEFLRAGTGRYSLTGDTYTETVDLASTANFTPGTVYNFRITLTGDTWTLDGGSGGTQIHEVWRRVR